MPTLIITDTSGVEKKVEARAGFTLMEVIRENGFADLEAICGGSCSCGTCHVLFDPAFWEMLPPMRRDEKDLLDALDSFPGRSRLSCQIPIVASLEGLRVTIAPAI